MKIEKINPKQELEMMTNYMKGYSLEKDIKYTENNIMKEQIKNDMKDAMRNKDTVTRDVLRVVLGEIERNPPETDVLQIIKKMATNLEIMVDTDDEIAVLQRYLPKELTRVELEELVDQYIVDEDLEGMKDMGRIMNYFKSQYPNQYDGKLLSTIAREVL